MLDREHENVYNWLLSVLTPLTTVVLHDWQSSCQRCTRVSFFCARPSSFILCSSVERSNSIIQVDHVMHPSSQKERIAVLCTTPARTRAPASTCDAAFDGGAAIVARPPPAFDDTTFAPAPADAADADAADACKDCHCSPSVALLQETVKPIRARRQRPRQYWRGSYVRRGEDNL